MMIMMRFIYHGFQLHRQRIKRQVITDPDLFDDLALLEEEIAQALKIEGRIEQEAAKFDLHCNDH